MLTFVSRDMNLDLQEWAGRNGRGNLAPQGYCWVSRLPVQPNLRAVKCQHALAAWVIKVFFGDRQSMFLKRNNVSFNCLFDIGDSFLLRFSLTDATEQARAFSSPIAIFAWVNNHLSHCYTSIRSNEKNQLWRVFAEKCPATTTCHSSKNIIKTETPAISEWLTTGAGYTHLTLKVTQRAQVRRFRQLV